ncbi:hypothetical protein BT69DRAFT_1335503 [Atractiella rhizophila]|nr:hypothetical protein BT69DRAFT_1335503 [Atractiella rhizophila]
MHDDSNSNLQPFTSMFHLPDNRSEVMFKPMALYFEEEGSFVPLSEGEESSIPSTSLGIIIQISCSPTRSPAISLCTITHLPTEILSLIFEILSFDKYEHPIEDLDDEYLVSFKRVSAISQLWKAVSVPYFDDLLVSMKKRHARLKAYPNAGRLWTKLWFWEEDYDVSVEMVKDVIAGSPNVRSVYIVAFWNEDEAKIVLHAIEGLRKLDCITFRCLGLRKWKKDEDPASSTSPGLQLSSELKRPELHTYPPLPSLSLPPTLTYLDLSNLCPLPPSQAPVYHLF